MRFADRTAGFHARCAQQRGQSASGEAELRTHAEFPPGRSSIPCVAARRHALFELRNVLFEIAARAAEREIASRECSSPRSETLIECPVTSFAQLRLQLLRIAVFAAVSHGEFQAPPAHRRWCVAKLHQHAEPFAPARAARRLVARSFKQLIVARNMASGIFAQLGEVLCRVPRESLPEFPRRNAPRTRNSCANPSRKSQPRAIRKDQGADTATATRMPRKHFAHAVQREQSSASRLSAPASRW